MSSVVYPLAPEWLVYFIAAEILVIFALCIFSLVVDIYLRIKKK